MFQKYESLKYKRASPYVAEQIRNGFTLPFTVSCVLPSQYTGTGASSAMTGEESLHLMEYRRASVVV